MEELLEERKMEIKTESIIQNVIDKNKTIKGSEGTAEKVRFFYICISLRDILYLATLNILLYNLIKYLFMLIFAETSRMQESFHYKTEETCRKNQDEEN